MCYIISEGDQCVWPICFGYVRTCDVHHNVNVFDLVFQLRQLEKMLPELEN